MINKSVILLSANFAVKNSVSDFNVAEFDLFYLLRVNASFGVSIRGIYKDNSAK
ncbi:hypothetical protein BROOK1789B_1332 [Bathymodiolus brooksi thiotrophic gill symbiont]|nr:hypothetical protein BROOK1789B_1332 [Bathymodiolus brooksi thiotrophic gill symbiont]